MSVVRDVEKDLFTALSKDIVGAHATVQGGTKKHPHVVDYDVHIPAWLVVGGAVGLWILGMGLAPSSTADGRSTIILTQRPRLVFPFASGTGGTDSVPAAAVEAGLAGLLGGFFPIWRGLFGR